MDGGTKAASQESTAKQISRGGVDDHDEDALVALGGVGDLDVGDRHTELTRERGHLGQDAGVAPFPVNIDGVTRVNSAFGYVDPVRDRLLVAGDAPGSEGSLAPSAPARGGRAARHDHRDRQHRVPTATRR